VSVQIVKSVVNDKPKKSTKVGTSASAKHVQPDRHTIVL